MEQLLNPLHAQFTPAKRCDLERRALVLREFKEVFYQLRAVATGASAEVRFKPGLKPTGVDTDARLRGVRLHLAIPLSPERGSFPGPQAR